jgi:hypothetical protein
MVKDTSRDREVSLVTNSSASSGSYIDHFNHYICLITFLLTKMSMFGLGGSSAQASGPVNHERMEMAVTEYALA